jgi:site-specific DNA-methyltransferase (adenine-specific)
MNHQLYHGDCLEVIPRMENWMPTCIFADPPDNIGLGYNEYPDRLSDEDYVKLLDRWLHLFVDTAFTTWFSFNVKWTIDVSIISRRLQEEFPDLDIHHGVQTFTFGQHNKRDFGNNHRPLWRFRRHDACIYPEQIKVKSKRQEMGDKRAAPGGRVPGDVHNFPLLLVDVYDYPRVTGNSGQRRKWHPTQLHEGLVERCIKSCTVEGNTVCDPFAGTGTTLRVCERIGRSCVTMDTDRDYCEKISEENGVTIL